MIFEMGKKGGMDMVLVMLRSVKCTFCFDMLEIPGYRTTHTSPCPRELLFPLYIIVLICLDRGCLMITQDASQDFIRLIHSCRKLKKPSSYPVVHELFDYAIKLDENLARAKLEHY